LRYFEIITFNCYIHFYNINIIIIVLFLKQNKTKIKIKIKKVINLLNLFN
jgi:hypothetical protein